VGAICERCGDTARLRRFCAKCKQTVADLTRQYVHAAGQILARKGPLGSEWADLERWRVSVGLSAEDARQAIAGITDDWLRRYAAFAASDGVVTESIFRRAAEVLNAEPSLIQALGNQLERAHQLGRVRTGDLPRVSAAGLHLPTDEHCYLNVPTIRMRYLKSGVRQTPGQLVVTNRKVRFVAYQHGAEIPLSKVHSVIDFSAQDLSLKATSAALSGYYRLTDAEWAAAVIDTVLRIDRRTLLPGTERRSPVPRHVRNEVWQRDHGRCVQCEAQDYLEFDHIIPRSRGGADTVGNIQLLCRRCNQKKSNRI
jgi:hypothetical protein